MGHIDVWEHLRQTVPYNPKTPSTPGSASEGEPDPFRKDLPAAPDSPPPQPLRKAPGHNALVLEEVRQRGNKEHIDATQSPESTGFRTADGRLFTFKDFQENPGLYKTLGPDDTIAKPASAGRLARWIEEIRQQKPKLYADRVKANIASDAEAVARQEDIAKLPKAPDQQKPEESRFNMEGVLTAKEVLAEIRKQLPPRPLTDTPEPSDYWPWDSQPSTPTEDVEADKGVPPLPTPVTSSSETPPAAPPLPIPKHFTDKTIQPAITDKIRSSLNNEIENFSPKNLRKTGKADFVPNEESSQPDDRSPTSQLKTSTQDDNGRGHSEPGNEKATADDFYLAVIEKITDLEQQLDGIQGKATDVEGGVTALSGKTKILENGITSLNSRTAGMDDGISGLDIRVTGLEHGFGSVNEQTSKFENGISSLGSRTTALESGVRSLNSKTAGVEKGIIGLNSITSRLEDGIPDWEESIERIRLSTDGRLDGVDGRLTEMEGKIDEVERNQEQTPALKRLLNDGRDFGGHLQNLNDGLQNARAGIAHLNEGFEGTRNALQTHAHYINHLDNEIIVHKQNADQQHEEVVKRVDGLKKMLTAFGFGAGALALTGFGLWGWSAVRKWMKKNKERKEFEAAAMRGPTVATGVGMPQMQQVGGIKGLKKRRAHARQWTRLDV